MAEKGAKNSSSSDLLHKSKRGGQARKNLFMGDFDVFVPPAAGLS